MGCHPSGIWDGALEGRLCALAAHTLRVGRDMAEIVVVGSLNMDLMIYGGEPLPPELKEEAMNVKKIILDIMQKGAAGDF